MDVQQVEARPRSLDRYAPAEIAPGRSGNIELPHATAVRLQRVPTKHLLTLQEGVSENQFKEMVDFGVQLVVPAKLTDSFPRSVRPHLQTFESFIGDIRLLGN